MGTTVIYCIDRIFLSWRNGKAKSPRVKKLKGRRGERENGSYLEAISKIEK
jgi:hypothetical protein